MGKAYALFVCDEGDANDLQWVCFVNETRACVTFRNRDILLQTNPTMGIGCKDFSGLREIIRKRVQSRNVEALDRIMTNYNADRKPGD